MRLISPAPAFFAVFLALTLPCAAQDYTAPAGDRAAAKRLGAESILPGGRLLTPLGRQHVTGLLPLAIAISPNGKRIATADGEKDRHLATVFHRAGPSLRREHFEASSSVNLSEQPAGGRDDFRGIVFDGNNRIYVSEGRSGRILLLNAGNGELIRTYGLNQGDRRESDSAGLALDVKRKRLYVVDRMNHRMAVVDTGSGRVTHSVPVGHLPERISLSPDKQQAFVSGKEVAPDPKDSEAHASNLLTVVDLAGSEPRAVTQIPIKTSSDRGIEIRGPSGLLVTEGAVYVATGANDAVTVVDRAKLAISGEIPLRIPGLESLRGILPMGMAFDDAANRLYVAEAGINAIAVIDPAQHKVLGHLPVGWFPTDLQVHGGNLYVTNAKGQGTGPNATKEEALPLGRLIDFGHGTLSVIPLAETRSLETHTARVMANNGFTKNEGSPLPIPGAIRNLVIILKGNRSYDEVFGDIEQASNGPVNGAPALARLGNLGYARQERSGLITRGELKDLPITPNHRALAERFAFSDNYYPDSEADIDAFWHHLDRHGVSFRRFGESGDGVNLPDQFRADEFIAALEEAYRKPGKELPRILSIHLPNDRMAPPRPEDGYPYRASYVADNDIALGRIVEYLSMSPWWPEMAILISEENAQGGVDHVDSHRSFLLIAGPYARRNYASHRNSGTPGWIKTALRILGIPPLNLRDASAADLSDCFTNSPDFRPYELRLVKKELFDPEKARAASAPN
ncbi:MAG: hypothetical protein IT169_18560 [Bryobacterales bacterium]|nr:hypothetical protein [Bryobacterales bacterium]